MTETPSLNVPTWAKAAGLALLVALLFWSVSSNDTPANGGTEPDSGLPQGEAWHNCKEAVRGLLNNPETADFSILSTTIDETSNGYDIDGSLTAGNDFGVKQEIAFSCNVWPDGEVEAEVSSR